jgi:hypothetical protein
VDVFESVVLRVSTTGLVAAVGGGDAWVTVVYQRVVMSVALAVRPDGAFRVRGRVVEPGNLTVAQATVEVVDGPSAGRSVVMPEFGFFELWLGGTVTLRSRAIVHADGQDRHDCPRTPRSRSRSCRSRRRGHRRAVHDRLAGVRVVRQPRRRGTPATHIGSVEQPAPP